jgi:hypothetical protein
MAPQWVNERCDKAVDYSLIVDVAMDALHMRLDSTKLVAGERGRRGSISGKNLCIVCMMMGKMSSQNCSSDAQDLSTRARNIAGVGGSDQAPADHFLTLANF